MNDSNKIPSVQAGQYYPWSTAEIQAVVAAEIAKTQTQTNPPTGGFLNWTVKDWTQFAAVIVSVAGVFGFGLHGYQKSEAIKSSVDAVQQKQDSQEKKAEEVKEAIVVVTDAQKKISKAQSDSIGDYLKLMLDRAEANAKDVDATPEDKKLAEDARKAYQAHIDRQKNSH